ncbi:hypothetical protein DPM19_25830 [Actinomadura craniellae]|uniref:Uncharacterized protein n=1 Tax=Actinomadura craniellae TaxID=2231787 RepID=A0A365GZ90_9ACTN|nr:hypothetical protein [Actinomadura craniellae]RAY12149.1 hypothetical protein DPM19_25830 [Actinomadura craniellae]
MIPAPLVARPVTSIALIGLAMVYFLMLPVGFGAEPYVGVMMIIGCGLALGAGFVHIVTDRNAAWGYTLGVGLLSALGPLAVLATGLPLVEHRVTADRLLPHCLGLAFLGAVTALLAGATLVLRHRGGRPRTDDPVTSARERARRTAHLRV